MPLAPIKTVQTQGASAPFELRDVEAEIFEKATTFFRYGHFITAIDQIFPDDATEQRNAVFSGKVIVTNSGLTKGGIFRACPHPLETRALGKVHQRFQNQSHIRICQTVITMPPLFLRAQKIRVREFREMATDSLNRYSGYIRQFADGQGALEGLFRLFECVFR